MKMSEKEFKKSICSQEKRVYVELAISDMLKIDFDKIHNNIIVDDQAIVNDSDIPIAKRPYCTVFSFGEYIIIIFKNNSLEEKEDVNCYKIVEQISHKYPDRQVCSINFNEFTK